MLIAAGRVAGVLLFLYAIYYAFTHLFGTLPPPRDRHIRTSWEITVWCIDIIKTVIIAAIGLMLFKLL